jgi:HK97 family phage portal protein
MLDTNDPFSEIAGWEINRPSTGPEVRRLDDTLHLRWWSPLGRLGVSPLYKLASTLTNEAAAVQWTLSNLSQSARPSGMVEMTDAALELRPEDRRKLYEKGVEDFRTNYGGPEKAGLLPVIPPGFKWTTASHTTAVEAELMAQRMANRNEVAAIYMIPPPMIGQLERSTFNNITTLRELAYTDGLAPPLVLIEQLLTAHVCREMLREDDTFVEFDLGMILRGDRLKEIQALREGIRSALYTPNEGRAALNMPKSDADGADKLWLEQNNLAPIDQPPEPKNTNQGPGAPPAAPSDQPPAAPDKPAEEPAPA